MNEIEETESVIKLLRRQREIYEERQKFHYKTFAALMLVLLLDFIVIIYTRAVTLNAYAWSGIILLFVLIAVEAIQYNNFKMLIESLDNFYLRGEHALKR